MLTQCVLGLAYAVLLEDVFFLMESSIPFTRPRLTESGSLPLTLAVYIFGLPVLLLLCYTLQHWINGSLLRLGMVAICAVDIHAILHRLRELPSHPVSENPFLGENDSDVQILGLSI